METEVFADREMRITAEENSLNQIQGSMAPNASQQLLGNW